MSCLPNAAVPDLCARLALALTSLAGYANSADQPPFEVIKAAHRLPSAAICALWKKPCKFKGLTAGF